MPDYTVQNHGSIFLVVPHSLKAIDNLHTMTDGEAQFLGNALAVEHRYIESLVEQLREEGWDVT